MKLFSNFLSGLAFAVIGLFASPLVVLAQDNEPPAELALAVHDRVYAPDANLVELSFERVVSSDFTVAFESDPLAGFASNEGDAVSGSEQGALAYRLPGCSPPWLALTRPAAHSLDGRVLTQDASWRAMSQTWYRDLVAACKNDSSPALRDYARKRDTRLAQWNRATCQGGYGG